MTDIPLTDPHDKVRTFTVGEMYRVSKVGDGVTFLFTSVLAAIDERAVLVFANGARLMTYRDCEFTRIDDLSIDAT